MLVDLQYEDSDSEIEDEDEEVRIENSTFYLNYQDFKYYSKLNIQFTLRLKNVWFIKRSFYHGLIPYLFSFLYSVN